MLPSRCMEAQEGSTATNPDARPSGSGAGALDRQARVPILSEGLKYGMCAVVFRQI